MHNNTLKNYFPLIRERDCILTEIRNNKTLNHTFNSWPVDFQNNFLDIFKKLGKNKNVDNELDAWLSFLVTDKPEDVIDLIERYPDFIPLYNVVYEMCRNMEDVMGLFSEELRIMDKNTVRFMIDEMQKEIDEKTAALADKDAALADKDAQLAEKDALIAKLMANQG